MKLGDETELMKIQLHLNMAPKVLMVCNQWQSTSLILNALTLPSLYIDCMMGQYLSPAWDWAVYSDW